jgi:pimeloyl-ACP methyl ester carboxylesterase
MTVFTADGRELEVLTSGATDGFPLVYHSGSPSAAVPSGFISDAAEAAGLRLVTWSRPGYGGSTPRPRAEPRFADDVEDTVAVLDALGVGEFVTWGWSGGGPRALACAALLPDRCRAAAILAAVGPYDADGLDWSAGMAEENVTEYAAAAAGREAYTELMTEYFLPMSSVTAEEVSESLGGLLTPVDRASVTDELAEYLASGFRRATAQGVVGVVDDGLAAVSPWGFDLADIRAPVAVWQGREDAMVPFAHGEWLAAHVPGARAHLLEDEGHLSLIGRLPEILDELKDLAGL